MYIYELPYDINKELCRLLDHNDDWKELAGVHMKYSAFDVNEIEQESRRQNHSPSNQLFIKWGQLNHRVEELFILLHRMKHVLAMRCLVPIVDARFHKLLKKQDICNATKEKEDTAQLDENTNRLKHQKLDGSDLLPLPVILMERGVQLPSSSDKIYNGNATTDDSSSEASSKGTNNELIMCQVPAIPMIKYEELKEATDNWSEKNLLGRGGFGQVFQGKWKLLSVAIKRLRDFDGINKELISEMCLNQYRHDNILPLYGYSHGGPESCLVYQLMSGGSLEQRLKRKTQRHLTWSQRYRIAHGVASGLQYLHNMSGTPLIHGDIKPANILLDQCTMPKIGDFGLARRGPYGENRTHLKVSKVHGTRPYLPEEYLRSRCLSPGVDVFSYGVVLLEIASALPAFDRNRKPELLSDFIHKVAEDGKDFAILEDTILPQMGDSNPALCRRFVEIGLHCTNLSRHQRPTMLLVYKTLDAMQFPEKTTDNYMA